MKDGLELYIDSSVIPDFLGGPCTVSTHAMIVQRVGYDFRWGCLVTFVQYSVVTKNPKNTDSQTHFPVDFVYYHTQLKNAQLKVAAHTASVPALFFTRCFTLSCACVRTFDRLCSRSGPKAIDFCVCILCVCIIRKMQISQPTFCTYILENHIRSVSPSTSSHFVSRARHHMYPYALHPGFG